MYKLKQYLRLIDNREKVQSGCIDFDLFLQMSVSYHHHNENEEITKIYLVMKYIEYEYKNNDFRKLKIYLENALEEIKNNTTYQKDEEYENQMAKILDDIFEDIASWEDYGFQPINITLSYVNEDEIENELILLDERFYYKLYKHIERRNLYLYNTGGETKTICTEERITTINEFLELMLHLEHNNKYKI